MKPGIRIVGGIYRGFRLRTPKGRSVRPTPDRVREALFNILGNRVVGARVVDCFAGTGALGAGRNRWDRGDRTDRRPHARRPF